MDAIRLTANYLARRGRLPLPLTLRLKSAGVAIKAQLIYSGESQRRDEYERRIQAMFTEFTDADITNPTGADDLRNEMTAALLILLAGIYVDYVVELSNAVGVAIDMAVIQRNATAWAGQYVPDIVRGIMETTVNALDELTRQRLAGQITEEQFADGSLALLSSARVDMIAATETTAALSAGVEWYIAHIAAAYGVETMLAWFTERDDRVCPICAPRHGKLRGDGWDTPPPAHPRCRCWLDLRVTA